MRVVAVCLGALMLLPLGCGEDEKDSSKEDSKAGAAEYRREGNALCRQAEKEVERLPQPTDPQGLGDYFDEGADVTQKYTKRFEALRPPADLRTLHQQAVRDNEEGIRYFRRLAREFRSSDNPTATFKAELPGLIRLVEKGNRISRRLGLNDCVEDLRDLQAQPGPSQS